MHADARGSLPARPHAPHGRVAMSMTLAQSGNQVTGTGSLDTPSASVALDITGTFLDPNFSLTVSTTCCQPFTFIGRMANGTLVGTLNGSGFTDLAVTLRKQ